MMIVQLIVRILVAIVRFFERLIGFDRTFHLSGGRQTAMSQLIFGRTPVRGGDEWHKHIDDREMPINETTDEHINRVTRNIARDIFVEKMWQQLLVVATIALVVSWSFGHIVDFVFEPVRSYVAEHAKAKEAELQAQVDAKKAELEKYAASKEKEMGAIK